jgi:hypothetical protein
MATRFSFTLSEYEYGILENYSKDMNIKSLHKSANELLVKGLKKYEGNEETNELKIIIRELIKFTLKPYTESLASMTSKVAHMNGRSLFLLVQVLIDGLTYSDSGKQIKELLEEAKQMGKNNMIVKGD